MKSNITIASNVFNRVDDNVKRDPAFVARVAGRPAIKKMKDQYGGSLDGVRLTPWQERIYSEDTGCSFAKNGEMTHGLVRKGNDFDWEGRCEYSDCDGLGDYRKCQGKSKANYNRNITETKIPVEKETSPLTYKWLGDIDDIFQAPEIEDLSVETDIPPEVQIENIASFVSEDLYTKTDTPTPIIEATIESRILVNAAPGSGKTYAVIRRLEYIIRNRLVEDFSNILVLVYTNAAKNEILKRLEAGRLDGSLPYNSASIDVCTFDSLATDYLATTEEKFVYLGYNERIKRFNKLFMREDFSNFEYVIVDELQDLVNERAKMVLNIIGALQYGYLLLGDKCQAIYDYDCADGESVNSVEFYSRLNSFVGDDIVRYELIGNQRQSEPLAATSESLRYALLGFPPREANEIIADELKQIEVIGKIESFNFRGTIKRTAILCRNNGEAEYVSHLLHKKGITHTLLRSVTQGTTLKRFIADCLWDYHADSRITREVFIKRFRNRVADDEVMAGAAFDELSMAVYENITDNINVEELAGKLSSLTSELSSQLVNIADDMLTVSTIHKAKGREFDTVYLLDSYFNTQEDNTEEARVWYVGFTRAKTDIFKLSRVKSPYFKRSTIQDRIFTHIRNLVKRTFKKESEQYGIVATDARVFEHSELTSRKSAKEIKDTLDKLTISYAEHGCYSYVLASNMLSVGIDIDRLGVMTVYNQPKSNAEYIQATSRVGRRNPGIILAMYNNMRSRDKSHYEQFGYYHKSFYRYVEATSVTPFSLRAIEKALHCIFVSLVRLSISGLTHNQAARYFTTDFDGVDEIIEYIVKRVGELMPRHSDFAESSLRSFAYDWEAIAGENSNTLCYKSYSGQPSLLSSAEDDEADFEELPKILNSLRNVEPSVNIFFRR